MNEINEKSWKREDGIEITEEVHTNWNTYDPFGEVFFFAAGPFFKQIVFLAPAFAFGCGFFLAAAVALGCSLLRDWFESCDWLSVWSV